MQIKTDTNPQSQWQSGKPNYHDFSQMFIIFSGHFSILNF